MSIPAEKKQLWQGRIRQQKESGLSIEKWCRDHQITSHAYRYWKERLYPKTPEHLCFKELKDL